MIYLNRFFIEEYNYMVRTNLIIYFYLLSLYYHTNAIFKATFPTT